MQPAEGTVLGRRPPLPAIAIPFEPPAVACGVPASGTEAVPDSPSLPGRRSAGDPYSSLTGPVLGVTTPGAASADRPSAPLPPGGSVPPGSRSGPPTAARVPSRPLHP